MGLREGPLSPTTQSLPTLPRPILRGLSQLSSFVLGGSSGSSSLQGTLLGAGSKAFVFRSLFVDRASSNSRQHDRNPLVALRTGGKGLRLWRQEPGLRGTLHCGIPAGRLQALFEAGRLAVSGVDVRLCPITELHDPGSLVSLFAQTPT